MRENQHPVPCPCCHFKIEATSICESLWKRAKTNEIATYACCGKPLQEESVYNSVGILTNNEHVGLQVMDLRPPLDNIQVSVFGAYGVVVRERVALEFIATTEARTWFAEEYHKLIGSGTRLPILIGTLDNKPLLIDGMHRINDAANACEQRIPVFRLNELQTRGLFRKRTD